MTAGLETFAKVRALHDRATIPGEKAAAMTRMQTLARKAGMSVEQAVSKFDTPKPQTQAQATADAFNEFFNSPKMRAQRAEMDRKREVRRAEILKRYGSRKAVYAETEREAALRTACASMTTWRRRGDPGSCTLDGWDWLQSREKIPPRVRSAVAEGWPLPQTVRDAWAEYIASEERESERQALHDYEHFAAPWVEVRRCILEDLLDSLPAHLIGDMLVRQSWLEHLNERGFTRDVARDTVLLATQRADIERMGARLRDQDAEAVQSGQAARGVGSPDPRHQSGEGVFPRSGENLSAPDPGTSNEPVQSGHPRRTNSDKRRDVLALLNTFPEGIPLTDREIARRAGVSPTTVGTIRRSLA